MKNRSGQIQVALAEALAPIVAADGGAVYMAEAGEDELLLHWAGRYAGSPACVILHEELALPIIRRLAPGVVVKWSSGRLIPDGAKLIEPLNGRVSTNDPQDPA
jgi:hypothetical protein